MKMIDFNYSRKVVVAIAFLLTGTLGFAQNDCGSAITVTDLTGTNCATSAPSLTNAIGPSTCEEGSLDTWFQFTAQGSSADITVSNTQGGWRPEFVIVQSTPASSCAGAFSTFSCSDANGNYNSLTTTGISPLVVGETYWIVVSSHNNNTNGTISVCVDNAAAGPCQDNELCSTPLVMTLNAPGGGAACVTDCNTNALAGPDFAGNNCYDLPNETVWYSITTDATTATLDISVTSTDLSDPEYTLFTTPDCANFTIIDCQEGTSGSASGTGIAVNPSTTYIIAVSDVTGDEGDFDLCVTQHAAPTGNCVDNQDCSTPEVLTLNASGGAALCLADCNTGATAGPDFTGNNCQDLPNATVWYQFTTDASAATLDVDLTSTDMSDPEFTIFTTTDCALFTTIFCNEGTGGAANSTFIPIVPNTTYLIAVSDATGDEGDFNLCITQNPDNSACNTNNTLAVTSTSMGSPLTGPFIENEVVTFCYTINGWITNTTNCNYLQGIIPTFGDCWDASSFTAQGEPSSITTALTTQGTFLNFGVPAGTWDWEPAGTVLYNLPGPSNTGLTAGDDVGAGWYFTTSYQAHGGDPDLSFGDHDWGSAGTAANCADMTSVWQVCFELTAKGDCNTGTDCSVSIKTYADGEIGSWADIGCSADIATTSSNVLNCILPIELGALTGYYENFASTVEWTTLSEDNVSHFIITHMNDKGEENVLGTVTAVGNSQDPVDYRFVDEKPMPGINYYNLKAVDFDGTTKNHGSVAVNADFNYAYYDSDAKEIVLTYDASIEVYSMDGSLLSTSKAGTRIPFEGQGVFLIRDLNSGFMQRLVTH